MKEIEVFILIDSDGNYDIGCDEESASERYNDGDTTDMRRMIKVTLNVPLPKLIEVPAIQVPEEKLTVEVK